MKPIFTLFLFLLMTTSLFAQENRGAIMGTVRNDLSGDVVNNVKINIEIQGALVKYGISDENGYYSVYNLKEGDYDVVLSAMGFQPYKIEGVPVYGLNNTQLNLTFPGEGYAQDTIVVHFEDLPGNSSKKKKDQKKSKQQRKMERAANRLD